MSSNYGIPKIMGVAECYKKNTINPWLLPDCLHQLYGVAPLIPIMLGGLYCIIQVYMDSLRLACKMFGKRVRMFLKLVIVW